MTGCEVDPGSTITGCTGCGDDPEVTGIGCNGCEMGLDSMLTGCIGCDSWRDGEGHTSWKSIGRLGITEGGDGEEDGEGECCCS